MDIKYVNPFIEALKIVLTNFGAEDIKKGGIQKKDDMYVDMDITSVIGIIGAIRGNIAYSFSQDTAKKLVSAMMMGQPVNEMDMIARSAIGELANMITGTASSILAKSGVVTDVTPPSIIFGKDVYFIISSVQTIALAMETKFGKIEINIGLEV